MKLKLTRRALRIPTERCTHPSGTQQTAIHVENFSTIYEHPATKGYVQESWISCKTYNRCQKLHQWSVLQAGHWLQRFKQKDSIWYQFSQHHFQCPRKWTWTLIHEIWYLDRIIGKKLNQVIRNQSYNQSQAGCYAALALASEIGDRSGS